MAVEFSLHSDASVSELLDAVREALPEAVETDGDGEICKRFRVEFLWVSIGTSSADDELENHVYLRLDKFERDKATALALRCVREVLDTTTDDATLTYLADTVILQRKAGRVRAYGTTDRNSFWDSHSIEETLGIDAPIRRTKRRGP